MFKTLAMVAAVAVIGLATSVVALAGGCNGTKAPAPAPATAQAPKNDQANRRYSYEPSAQNFVPRTVTRTPAFLLQKTDPRKYRTW